MSLISHNVLLIYVLPKSITTSTGSDFTMIILVDQIPVYVFDSGFCLKQANGKLGKWYFKKFMIISKSL